VVEQVEPAGAHELPQGFYSTLGDACYDDRFFFGFETLFVFGTCAPDSCEFQSVVVLRGEEGVQVQLHTHTFTSPRPHHAGHVLHVYSFSRPFSIYEMSQERVISQETCLTGEGNNVFDA